MSRDVDIVNRAYSSLGLERIDTIGDSSKQGGLAHQLYPGIKRAFLRSYPWNAAVKRIHLAPLVDEPVNQFPIAYAKPADCLRILDIYHGDYQPRGYRRSSTTPYQVESNRILCWEENLNMRYIADIAEPDFDPLMETALVLKVAAEMAYAVTNSTATADAFMARAMIALKDAQTADNMENPHEYMETDQLRVVRY